MPFFIIGDIDDKQTKKFLEQFIGVILSNIKGYKSTNLGIYNA